LILLDTHALIWWVAEPAKLSRRAARAMQKAAAGGGIAVSAASLFEISTLLRRGRLELGVPAERWLQALGTLPDLVIEPISAEIAWMAGSLAAGFPGDPADRLIVATARSLNARLVTADEKLRAALAVDAIW